VSNPGGERLVVHTMELYRNARPQRRACAYSVVPPLRRWKARTRAWHV